MKIPAKIWTWTGVNSTGKACKISGFRPRFFPGLNFWIQPGLLPRQTNLSPENWWLKDVSFFLKRFWGHVNFRCRGGGGYILIEVGKSPCVSIVKFKVAIYDASAMTVGNITVRNSGCLPVTNTQRLVVYVYICIYNRYTRWWFQRFF